MLNSKRIRFDNRFLIRHYLSVDMLLRSGERDGSYEKSNTTRDASGVPRGTRDKLSEAIHVISRLDDFCIQTLRSRVQISAHILAIWSKGPTESGTKA